MYQIARNFLFLLDAEAAHHLTFTLLKFYFRIPGIKSWYQVQNKKLQKPKIIDGVTYKNPLGLAAGFDKNALLFNEFGYLGFGFVEIGTITPKPQAGNPLPRLFRLKKDKAIINRMGFNNDGMELIYERLKKGKNSNSPVIGVNIGKNKDTPNENALNDYLLCFNKFKDLADYFVVNVSSPNTPGLRDLQEKEPLTKILLALKNENKGNIPIYLKIAPDLETTQINDVIDIIKTAGIQGVIITNTTISRSGLKTTDAELEKIGNGGLSGLPLKSRSEEVLQIVKSKVGNDFTIINVGGVMNGADAKQRLDNGADLVQVWTGFVYAGPAMIKDILNTI
jgi:dihydroorotate dehydrogenase